MCSAWAQDTRQQLGHLCQLCMLTCFYTKTTEIVGKPQPNDSFFTPCSAVQVTKINGWRGEKKGEIIKGQGCIVNLWRIKWACVYLSSPIDHHLKQEEWGRETSVQFSLVNTLLQEDAQQLRGSCAVREQTGKRRGWGGSLPFNVPSQGSLCRILYEFVEFNCLKFEY